MSLFGEYEDGLSRRVTYDVLGFGFWQIPLSMDILNTCLNQSCLSLGSFTLTYASMVYACSL
jgi:hypothetical protein